MIDLIASASRLENIHIWDARCHTPCQYLSNAIAPPLRRIALDIDTFRFTEYLMDWFCRCHPTPSVQTLLIDGVILPTHIPTVCNFIRYMGAALENLEIWHRGIDEQVRSKCISYFPY